MMNGDPHRGAGTPIIAVVIVLVLVVAGIVYGIVNYTRQKKSEEPPAVQEKAMVGKEVMEGEEGGAMMEKAAESMMEKEEGTMMDKMMVDEKDKMMMEKEDEAMMEE